MFLFSLYRQNHTNNTFPYEFIYVPNIHASGEQKRKRLPRLPLRPPMATPELTATIAPPHKYNSHMLLPPPLHTNNNRKTQHATSKESMAGTRPTPSTSPQTRSLKLHAYSRVSINSVASINFQGASKSGLIPTKHSDKPFRQTIPTKDFASEVKEC